LLQKKHTWRTTKRADMPHGGSARPHYGKAQHVANTATAKYGPYFYRTALPFALLPDTPDELINGLTIKLD
jgi:hypothetical protein